MKVWKADPTDNKRKRDEYDTIGRRAGERAEAKNPITTTVRI